MMRIIGVLIALPLIPYIAVRNTYRHWRYGCQCVTLCPGYEATSQQQPGDAAGRGGAS
jgi:hypothetical protein